MQYQLGHLSVPGRKVGHMAVHPQGPGRPCAVLVRSPLHSQWHTQATAAALVRTLAATEQKERSSALQAVREHLSPHAAINETRTHRHSCGAVGLGTSPRRAFPVVISPAQ
jgi:hypothetical protein